MKNFKAKLSKFCKKPATKVVAILLVLALGVLIGVLITDNRPVADEFHEETVVDQIEEIQADEESTDENNEVELIYEDYSEVEGLSAPTLVSCSGAEHLNLEDYLAYKLSFSNAHKDYYELHTGDVCILSDGSRLVTFVHAQPGWHGVPDRVEPVLGYPVVDQSVVWFTEGGQIIAEVDDFEYVFGDGLEAPVIFPGFENEEEIQIHFGVNTNYHEVWVLDMETFTVELKGRDYSVN